MNKFKYTVRPMRSVDIAEVEAIADECGLSFWSRSDYERHLEIKDGISLIVKDYKEKTIGFLISRLIITKRQDNIEKRQDNQEDNQANKISAKSLIESDIEEHIYNKCELEIYNIAVSRLNQSKGTGKVLLDKCVESTAKYVETNVWLEVRRSNIQGVNFYLRNGFEMSYVRKNYYSQPVEDALVMRLTVSGRIDA